MNSYKLISVCLFVVFIPLAGYAQGKVSLGIDAGLRFEKAHFHDPKGYLLKRLSPSGTIGLTVNYAHTDHWEFEMGLYNSNFHPSANPFYNEPGYMTPHRYSPYRTNGLQFLQIPIRTIYKTNLRYKNFNFSFLGGIHIYSILRHPDRSRRNMGGGLITLPVSTFGSSNYPSPPGIGISYDRETLSRTTLAFEAGTEIRYEFSKRVFVAYRFSGLLGTRDMTRLEGYYIVGDMPEVEHEFQVLQRGTGFLHMLALRYRLKRD